MGWQAAGNKGSRSDTKSAAEGLLHFGEGGNIVTLHYNIINVKTIVNMLPQHNENKFKTFSRK